MARKPLNNNGQEAASCNEKEVGGLDDEDYVGQEYHHNASSIDNKGSLETQEWSTGSSEKCNLIVNYLPHEIDDITLKVRTSSNKIGYLLQMELLMMIKT